MSTDLFRHAFLATFGQVTSGRQIVVIGRERTFKIGILAPRREVREQELTLSRSPPEPRKQYRVAPAGARATR
jgi:hypothetical protein